MLNVRYMSRIRSLIVHHGPDGNAQPGGFISNAIPTNGAFTARALFPSAFQLAVEKAPDRCIPVAVTEGVFALLSVTEYYLFCQRFRYARCGDSAGRSCDEGERARKSEITILRQRTTSSPMMTSDDDEGSTTGGDDGIVCFLFLSFTVYPQ